jgi:hypothetical protein
MVVLQSYLRKMILRDPNYARQLLIYVAVAIAALVLFGVYAYTA